MSTPPQPSSTPPSEPQGTPAPGIHDAMTMADTPLVPPQPATPAPTAPATPTTPAPASPAAPAPGFAPPTPAPAPAAPAPFGPTAGAGGPGNPWGPPAAFGGGVPGVPGAPGVPYPVVPRPGGDSNGLAVAALVLGSIGFVLGFFPFVFFLGGLTGAVGIGIGIAAIVRAARVRTGRAMAVAGTVLGVLALGTSVAGFAFTRSIVLDAEERVDRKVRDRIDTPYESRPSTSPKPAPSLPPWARENPAVAFGESVTLDDGITVSLSKPVMYKPSTAYGRKVIKNAVKITATVTNNGTKPLDVVYAVPTVTTESGADGELAFDAVLPEMIQDSIAPGATATGVFAFEVPEGTTRINAGFSPGMLLGKARFTGPIG
ncbi:DUF4190 domain-containing protein [Streptomyces sp. NPDC090022]|uniref:DUF4190 domain-containing protein n=1 Tax=Streptomyces sp. NPDC090022 TaxID=3365920 RepID=UPI003829960F